MVGLVSKCKPGMIIMAHKRTRSSRFPGIYWRETTDPQRRHNGRPDRCYDYCIRVGGKLKWVTVGWVSEGYSEQKAVNLRREALERLARGNEVDLERGDTLTLCDLAAPYLEWLEAEGKYASQERNRFETHVRDSLGHLPLIVLDGRVDGFKQDLLQRMAPGSALRLLTTCRAMVNYAIRTGKWNGVNPFGRDRLRMPTPQNKGERFLTPEEARNLLDELERRSLNYVTWLGFH